MKSRFRLLTHFPLFALFVILAHPCAVVASGDPAPLRIAVIGDSTVCNYPETRPDRGWGMFVEEYFKPGSVKVSNLAAGGRSTKTFILEGRWEKTLETKPAFVLIQFGHNDSHAPGKRESTDAATDYRDYLRRYIDETRAAGATPVLVTPMVRRLFGDDGKLQNELQPYADAVKMVGREKNVPVIDLHAASKKLVEQLGPEKSAEFANKKGDATHFNEKGARAMADIVMAGLPAAAPELAAYLKTKAETASLKTAARQKSFRQTALDALQVTPIKPTQVVRRGDVLFADFGKDAYANLKIEFNAEPPAGDVRVRLGEKISSDGTIDRKPPGSVNVREVVFQTQSGKRDYTLVIPMKRFHLGAEPVKMPESIGNVTPFRFVEIEAASPALATALAPDKITLGQLAVHAPFDESASAFESSDPVLNAVWDLCKHTMKATTTFGVYIDGERERIPYEADAYINMLSHYACDLDPRVARATFEHLLAHPTWPTEWSLQMPMIAFADYEATGDPVLAARHYDALKKKLFLEKARADGLLRVAAIVDWPRGERDGYNDGVIDTDNKQHVGPKVNTVANAFYYEALRSMARLAQVISRQDEVVEMEARAKQVRQAFNDVFFDSARGIYIDGEGSAHASLHANMFPLAFDLVPAERRDSVMRFVKSRGMACSVYGAQFLLEALCRNDEHAAALALMTAKIKRSWWHMIELGSTLTLEAWDAEFKPNLTWNHAWGAAPANIISRYVLGVRPLQPGGAKILIAPQPSSLTWMSGKVPTPHGPVFVSWKNGYADATLQITIPQGASARVELPVAAVHVESLLLDGSLADFKIENSRPVVESLSGGRHELKFKFTPQK